MVYWKQCNHFLGRKSLSLDPLASNNNTKKIIYRNALLLTEQMLLLKVRLPIEKSFKV